eukprot:TRINITY_DN43129_c0_g1_i1.p1 TRINITY_DN43129_c0_g1~~TRINITY_DN43129_c0_g1_i1.p1  ORF type:complete len:184 (+),score=32.95 TRINITY_DN43129_c0_g1_i1:48-599(+)
MMYIDDNGVAFLSSPSSMHLTSRSVLLGSTLGETLAASGLPHQDFGESDVQYISIANSFLQTTPDADAGPTREQSGPRENELQRQESTPTTTMMLRNIPCKVNAARIDEELRQNGFEGAYDSIHVPTRPNGSNRGYGFVNFKTADDAARFASVFNDYEFLGTFSTKRCTVSRADVQGRIGAAI